jgi:hypothetical protein
MTERAACYARIARSASRALTHLVTQRFVRAVDEGMPAAHVSLQRLDQTCTRQHK